MRRSKISLRPLARAAPAPMAPSIGRPTRSTSWAAATTPWPPSPNCASPMPAAAGWTTPRRSKLEVKQSNGQPVSPDSQTDDDLKLMAINGLMQSDPDRAIPAVENLLKGAQSPKLKGRALYVLAQSSSPKAQQLVEQVARGWAGNPDLQVKAFTYLGAAKRRGWVGAASAPASGAGVASGGGPSPGTVSFSSKSTTPATTSTSSGRHQFAEREPRQRPAVADREDRESARAAGGRGACA